MATTQKKVYPHDEEDKLMEEEILKAIKELTPLQTKIKALVLNTYLQQDKQLNLELEAELGAITLRYKNAAKPLIDRAVEIVSGQHPKEDELKGLNEYGTAEEIQKKDEIYASLKPLEGYWVKTLKQSAVFKTFLHDRDEEALNSLKLIKYHPSEDQSRPFDYTLTFTFGPNEFFENEVLTKKYLMKDEKDAEKTTGTEIKWKEGKNLTKKSVTKKQKNKKTGKTRTVTKEVDCESFFQMFKDCEPKKHEHKEDEECDDEDEHDHDDEMLDHVDFGSTLVEEILPYHLEYYLGVKKEPDFGAFGAGEDDEDDDGDDDSEDEKPKKAAKGGKKGGAAGGDAGAQKQQCNQQ